MSGGRVAVIGGSGFYDFGDLEDRREETVETPFGAPSDAIVTGRLVGREVAFLPRHGRGHRLSPSELPARANIYALKSLGVERIISVSACGSMKEEIAPLDVVVPDQLFDRTKARPSTFFEDGVVAHVSFADPFCAGLSETLVRAAEEAMSGGASPQADARGGDERSPRMPRVPRVHEGGTYVCMEGPQFSTRAESRIYRQLGVDVIGMTALPEAKLAREAEICYATLAFATDYDCWHETAEDVSVEMVVKNLLQNVETGKRIIRAALPAIPEGERSCPCASALATAIITQRDLIPQATTERLGILVSKYL